MTIEAPIIDLAHWLQTPAGHYLLDWEQQQMDRYVADLFGFHALQLGLPELDALRANRMPHRWVAALDTESMAAGERGTRVQLASERESLPFASQTLDLVVLPHTLEMAHDPHHTLREVDRVLVPEGRVVIVGLNPASLWGLRRRMARLRHRLALGVDTFMPMRGDFIGYWRMRDWLRLLSFEVEAGRFGCYRPPLSSQPWLDRMAWLDHTGDRWWPVLGAVYVLVAVKRVRGMRLVGLARNGRQKLAASTTVATNRSGEQQ